MSCQQVPTAPAFNPYPRSVQVGEFEVAIGGGIWVAIGALVLSSFSEPTRLRVAGGPLRKQSITYLTSFDCASKSFFVQETVWYDAPMAGGAAHTISSRVKPQWVSPDSKLYAGNLNVDILMVLCGKR